MIISNNFSSLYNMGVAVFVQRPTKRILHFDMDQNEECNCEECQANRRYKTSLSGPFFLSLPYVGFSIRYVKNKKRFSLDRAFLAFSTNAKLEKIYYPSLPNISEDLSICLGTTVGLHLSIEELCKCTVQKFWSSEFNDDILYTIDEYSSKTILGNPILWQNKTKKCPSWIPTSRNLVPCYDEARKVFFGQDFANRK